MTGTKTVLLVDDSNVTAKQLAQIIDGLDGYEVVARAANGAEAVQLYKSLTPDLVCMDIVLPVLDGIKAMQSILSFNPEAKVVVISSLGGSRDTVLAALRAGAKNVIAKPFESDAVRAVLDAL